MRKRYLFLMSLVAFFSIFFVGIQSQNVHAASQYGITRKYTTPKATRGYDEKTNSRRDLL